jgi:23S rRNA (adenine2503-C2)-methyltransferase
MAVERDRIGNLARLRPEWDALLPQLGGRAFHGKSVYQWIFARGEMDPNRFSDVPHAVRAKLLEAGIGAPADVHSVRTSEDGTRKVLLRLNDHAIIETVLIPMTPAGKLPGRGKSGAQELPSEDADRALAETSEEGDEDDFHEGSGNVAKTRVTQCISTQVGCAMGCTFCASGVAGLKRHMTASEIIAQVLLGKQLLAEGEALRNIVFMGMGEPLHNYEATARVLRLLSDADGLGLSKRRVTVSTSGLVPEIDRLGEEFEGQVALAVSVHAATDERRSNLMPINKKYPLAELMAALRRYPLPKRRRITIEYTLVAGQNDTPADANALIRLLRGIPVKINLIPMNPISASTLGPSGAAHVFRFQETLAAAGYACFIRRRRGDDVDAACGQLALLGAKPKVRSFVNQGAAVGTKADDPDPKAE